MALNRLAQETSPYLLQHAHNPVDWLPWGEEAFAKAKAENKPIFLSIGYSTCHWCHVMERESFENPAVAEVLNRHYVSIKVDREERPDVDHVYMAFVQASTGRGGWPMSVWLTPELEPFAGGTYFPPHDSHGRPGFVSILKNIAGQWEKEGGKIREHGQTVAGQLRAAFGAETARPAGPRPALREAVEGTFGFLEKSFDPEEGGFGEAPKFPRPVALDFLFHYAREKTPEDAAGTKALSMALFTLRKMAWGGMHDILGGGFHRYSVDGYWHVPHFEKMLYDQGQLLEAYLTAHQLTGEAFYADTARGILEYVRRDMTSPEGGFYSAEDADSLEREGEARKKEGAFYCWTLDEIEAVLDPEEARAFAHVHEFERMGNVRPEVDPHGEMAGKNVPIRRKDDAAWAGELGMEKNALEEALARAREKLLAHRSRRPRPHLDDKILASWNGMMIAAAARAGFVLKEPRWLELAERAAEMIREKLYDAKEGVLYRSYRQGRSKIAGFADDYAQMIRAVLALLSAGSRGDWLAWGLRLQEAMDRLFWDEDRGGYFSAAAGDRWLLFRAKEDYDGAEPSPNAVALGNLPLLAVWSGREAWQARAERLADALAPRQPRQGVASPLLLCGWMEAERGPVEMVLRGDPGDGQTRALEDTLRRHYCPGSVLMRIVPGGRLPAPLTQLEAMAQESRPAVMVCRDFACEAPAYTAEALREILKGADKMQAGVSMDEGNKAG
jgi:uncharacterized protein YyaL (SSP411 family)